MVVAPLTAASPLIARPGVLAATVAGVGAALPERVVSNDDLARTLDTSDDWIRSRTGIRQRHVIAADQATSDLAVSAGAAALADAGISAAEVDTVIVATFTPDHRMPATATLVAARLGTRGSAFDINAACSGFVYGLETAAALAVAGRTVLLIGAEALSRIVDADDRSTAVLFGDGAGAVVVVADEGGEIGPFDLGCDGGLADLLIVPGGGTRMPVPDDPRDRWLQMDGREVYRQAVTHMAASSRAVLDAAGLDVADVDLFIGHQANARILDGVVRRLGMDPAVAHVTVDRHANTSAASIPLALVDAVAAGRLEDGAHVLLTAFGAGLTWGSCLLRWKDAA